MHELAKRLLRAIRKHDLLHAGDRVAAAVSGGADSVALLYLLKELRGELGIVLSVAHVNHKLRGEESDDDEQFVARMAAACGLEFYRVDAPVESSRISTGSGVRATSGVEAAARELRYEFFRKLARRRYVARIATAHTLDDQAETVLLRMFRGTGIRGLAGVHPRIVLEEQGSAFGEVVRPLLGFRRAELRDYLQARGQKWREDSSNEDVSFSRNRVRQRLLPLIAEEFGEAAIEHMAELAEIARAEEEQAVSTQYPVSGPQLSGSAATSPKVMPGATLDVEQLLTLPLAAGRRLVRGWIENNAPEVTISFRLIEEILELARGAAGRKLELPGAAAGRDASGSNAGVENVRPKNARPKHVRRGRKELVLDWEAGSAASDYEYTLAVPGEIAVPELGARVEACMVDVESIPEQERDGLLDPERLGPKVVIRNWRAGDRYWPAHTAAEKKVKELLSDRHAIGAEKKLWPVGVNGDGCLVWIRGFAVPQAMRSRTGKAIWIREIGAGRD